MKLIVAITALLVGANASPFKIPDQPRGIDDITLHGFRKRGEPTDVPRLRRHFTLLEPPRRVQRSANQAANDAVDELLGRRSNADAVDAATDQLAGLAGQRLDKRADYGQQNKSATAPARGNLGGPFYHPSDSAIDEQNPDNISPPPTDNGVIESLKWSFSQSHTRLLNGGWVREQTITDLPASRDFSAAELSLTPGSYRELHCASVVRAHLTRTGHRVVEWAIVLSGSGRIAAIDSDGATSVEDVAIGDLCAPGVPHSIQASNEDHLEFLVLFGDGNFDSAGTTFMVDDWLAHTPLEVVAQNLGVNVSDLAGIPQKDPYIVRPTRKSPATAAEAEIASPNGKTNTSFVFKQSQQPAAQKKGGNVKIVDTSNWPITKGVASALVEIKPGHLRELHWHPTSEWFAVLSGSGRITAFAGGATSRTFDVRVGDSGVIPVSYGHYVQNTGNESLVFLEIFAAERYQDFSLTQWLALTPTQVVADTLNVSTSVVQSFAKDKQVVV